MSLGDGSTFQNKLRAVAELAERLYGDRTDMTSKDVEQLTSCPHSFVAVADLVCFTTRTRDHGTRPDASIGLIGAPCSFFLFYQVTF